MPPVSTTSLRAKEVMDRSAVLMNDPNRTDYTYDNQLPYLNMAIDELQEALEENNMSPTNQVAAIITLTAGLDRLTPQESATLPHYPYDLIEIREISERLAGTEDTFIGMTRKDFLNVSTPVNSLLKWAWIDQEIRFPEGGATSNRDLKLEYVRQPLQMAQNENSLIGTIGSRSYLGYKTAALCATFIGENPGRGKVLEEKAENALDRLLNIGAKGRQTIYTRRRPFRASYKSRGYV